MFNIMKGIRHLSLQGSANIIQIKRDFFVRKGSPRKNESNFVLVSRNKVNLVKTVHKGKNIASGTFVNDLIYKVSQIIIFKTCPIDITIVNTNMDSSFFLIYRKNIWYLICQWNMINETRFKKFSNFSLYGHCLSRVHGTKMLKNRLHIQLVWISCTTILESMPDIYLYDQAKTSQNSLKRAV